jgi:hypothetical protein
MVEVLTCFQCVMPCCCIRCCKVRITIAALSRNCKPPLSFPTPLCCYGFTIVIIVVWSHDSFQMNWNNEPPEMSESTIVLDSRRFGILALVVIKLCRMYGDMSQSSGTPRKKWFKVCSYSSFYSSCLLLYLVLCHPLMGDICITSSPWHMENVGLQNHRT